jgi:hypothetical protein
VVALTPQRERARDQRRAALMRSPWLKGLDHVAVAGEPRTLVQPDGGEAQRWTVRLDFVPAAPGSGKEALPERLAPRQVRLSVDGGSDPRLSVESVAPGPEPHQMTAVLRASERLAADVHDAPVYELELIDVPDLDPRFRSAPLRLDPGDPHTWQLPRFDGTEAAPRHGISDYLAKDYESFRRLLLERMAFHVPAWHERNPSDIGVTLVEVLAYAADYLSYQQDAVASEAYLGTARRRISVRRHARLLDFRLQEGTNARAWVQIELRSPPPDAADPGAPPAVLPARTRLLTTAERRPGVVAPGSLDHEQMLEEGALVFETLHDAPLHPGHAGFEVYTWGAADFTLERGATSAALAGHWPHLAAGDVLVIEKREGVARSAPADSRAPRSLAEARALAERAAAAVPDPRARTAVRLSQPPRLGHDPLTGVAYTEVRWFDEDALSADFPVSRAEGAMRRQSLTRLRGNVVLADHGRAVEELLPPVPAAGGYAPVLSTTELSWRVPFDPVAARGVPAIHALDQPLREALPEVELVEIPGHAAPESLTEARQRVQPWLPRWRPRFDLLGSSRFAREFVVETDERGRPHLRFGDGGSGRRPRPGSWFLARYRVGGGPRGNVGSQAIRHVVLDPALGHRLAAAGAAVEGARNHLPAAGGSHPVSAEYARIYAPDRIHTSGFQERCVTEQDSARLARDHPEVRRAVARHRWDGGGRSVELYVQRQGGLPLDAAFEARLRDWLRDKLLAGWDLALRPPRWVPLDVEVAVWIDPGEQVERIYRRFAEDRTGAGGGPIFDPDLFDFGQPVYLSRITSALLAVPGVRDVRVDAFHRWGRPPAGEREAGYVPIGPLEMPRLDNDPDAPQRGTFRIRFEEDGR